MDARMYCLALVLNVLFAMPKIVSISVLKFSNGRTWVETISDGKSMPIISFIWFPT